MLVALAASGVTKLIVVDDDIYTGATLKELLRALRAEIDARRLDIVVTTVEGVDTALFKIVDFPNFCTTDRLHPTVVAGSGPVSRASRRAAAGIVAP